MMCPTCFNKGWRFTLPPGVNSFEMRIPELTAAMIKVPCPDCHGGSQYCCEGDQCQPEPRDV